jgi:hypothetical protein
MKTSLEVLFQVKKEMEIKREALAANLISPRASEADVAIHNVVVGQLYATESLLNFLNGELEGLNDGDE